LEEEKEEEKKRIIIRTRSRRKKKKISPLHAIVVELANVDCSAASSRTQLLW
jgi:hypothetical protein